MVWPAVIAVIGALANKAGEARKPPGQTAGLSQFGGDEVFAAGGDTVSSRFGAPPRGPGVASSVAGVLGGAGGGNQIPGAPPNEASEYQRATQQADGGALGDLSGTDGQEAGGGFGAILSKIAAGAKVGSSLRGGQRQAPAPPNFGASARGFGGQPVSAGFLQNSRPTSFGEILKRFRMR